MNNSVRTEFPAQNAARGLVFLLGSHDGLLNNTAARQESAEGVATDSGCSVRPPRAPRGDVFVPARLFTI
jgi:hypothetical protein